jgi:beta-lactamase regulating signal transducer with metallopeptidase domain/multidrug resistance efflux pump
MIAAILNSSFLNAAFHWLLRATWQAAVLAVLVVAAQVLLRRWLSARARCLLWALVVARLVLPPLPVSRPTLFPSRPDAPVARAVPQTPAFGMAFAEPLIPPPPPPANIDPKRVAELRAELAAMPDDDVAGATSPADGAAPPPEAGPAESPSQPPTWRRPGALLWHAAPWIWLGGVVLLIGRLAWASLRLTRLVARLPQLTDSAFVVIAADCARQMGLSRCPPALRADHLAGPALAGLFRPRLLVPGHVLNRFPASELRLMLLHELAHVRRRDVLANWVLSALAAVHWFNPLIVLALGRARADRELACDEAVLLATSTSAGKFRRPVDERRAYGHTLLRLAEHLCGTAQRPASTAGIVVGVLQDKRQLERRILMILRFNPAAASNRWPALLAGGMLVLAGLTLTDAAEPSAPPRTTIPAAAQTPADPAGATDASPTGAIAAADPTAPAGTADAAGAANQFDGSYERGRGAPTATPAAAAVDPDAVRVLELRVAAREAELKMAASRYERLKQLESNKAVSAEEVDQAEAQLAKSKADLAEARFEVERARRGGASGAMIGDPRGRGGPASSSGEVAANVDLSAASVKVAQAQLEARAMELKHAQADLNRQKDLVGKGVASASELEQAEVSVAQAQATLEAAKAQVQQAKAALELAKTQATARESNKNTPMTTTPPPTGSGMMARGSGGTGAMGANAANVARGGGGMARAMASSDNTVQDAEAQRLDAQTAEKLRKPMKIHLNNGDLATAIQIVRETTGVDIIIDRSALGADGGSRPPPQVQDLFIDQPTPAAQVLTWILRNAGGGDSLGYAIDQGAVLVSTRSQLERLTVTRVYDVADLTRHQSAESVGELIAAVVAPGSWGRIGAVRQLDSHLVITQTQPNHAQIEKLLSLLRSKSAGAGARGGYGGYNDPAGTAAGSLQELSPQQIAMMDRGMEQRLQALAKAKAELDRLSVSMSEQHPTVVAAKQRVEAAGRDVEAYATEYRKLQGQMMRAGGIGNNNSNNNGSSAGAYRSFFEGARQKASLERTVSNMRQLLIAAQLYASDHDGKLPVDFPDEFRPYVQGDFAGLLANERVPGEKIGYVWLLSAQTAASALKDPSNTPVLIEKKKDWSADGGMGVGFADGHVCVYQGRDEFLRQFRMTPATP